HQLRRARAEDVRRNTWQAAVLVWRGQDRVRQRDPDLAPTVGPEGVLGVRDSAGPHRRLRLPAADRAGATEDSRRESAPSARHGRRGDQAALGASTATLRTRTRSPSPSDWPNHSALIEPWTGVDEPC